jgi:hypothetical protein
MMPCSAGLRQRRHPWPSRVSQAMLLHPWESMRFTHTGIVAGQVIRGVLWAACAMICIGWLLGIVAPWRFTASTPVGGGSCLLNVIGWRGTLGIGGFVMDATSFQGMPGHEHVIPAIRMGAMNWKYLLPEPAMVSHLAGGVEARDLGMNGRSFTGGLVLGIVPNVLLLLLLLWRMNKWIRHARNRGHGFEVIPNVGQSADGRRRTDAARNGQEDSQSPS